MAVRVVVVVREESLQLLIFPYNKEMLFPLRLEQQELEVEVQVEDRQIAAVLAVVQLLLLQELVQLLAH
jgi:hypothetical protein